MHQRLQSIKQSVPILNDADKRQPIPRMDRFVVTATPGRAPASFHSVSRRVIIVSVKTKPSSPPSSPQQRDDLRHRRSSPFPLLEFSRHVPRCLVRLGVVIVFLATRGRVLRPTPLPCHWTSRSHPCLVLLGLMPVHSVISRIKLAATTATAPPPVPMLVSTLTIVSATASPSAAASRRRDVATRWELSQLVVSVSKVATIPEPTFPILPPAMKRANHHHVSQVLQDDLTCHSGRFRAGAQRKVDP